MPPPRRTLLLGHRGARSTRSLPENTLASFDLCLNHGCDGFECDVRRTADGEMVVCHDATIAGLCLAKTRADRLGELQRTGLLPTLEKVLQSYARRCFLDIELKEIGMEREVADLLRRTPPQYGYVVSSFLSEVIVKVKAIDTRVPVGLIADTASQLIRWRHLPLDYVIPHRKLVKAELVTQLHAAGKKVLVWTVNTAKEAARLRSWGVDGIVTDNTQTLGHLTQIVQSPKLI
jgi:glycerophosphoryl diester phosphodiesterase